MSQQTNAGFNAPRLSVGADEPDGTGPSAAFATSFSGRAFAVHGSSGAPFQSRAEAVGHKAKFTWSGST